jgi:hypothetical protein
MRLQVAFLARPRIISSMGSGSLSVLVIGARRLSIADLVARSPQTSPGYGGAATPRPVGFTYCVS